MNHTIKKKDDTYIANTYRRYPVYVASGKGCWLIDDEGKEYLDFTCGIGVTGLGHCFEPWVQATTKQLHQLEHVSNLFYSKPCIDVAEKLCIKANMKHVFFANSGAEANEGAIKIARKYASDLYQRERNEIITLKNSFHGRTITTLTATGQDHFHQDFGPFAEGFTYVEANDIQALKASVSHKTMAIMVEVVQGEGGVIVVDKDYLQTIQDLCDKQDILLIIDEVQTGIGRCGSLFAYMQYNLHPDIVTCAKGLGNGLPIAAILMNEKCADVLSYGDHGTTFGGNPITCAGASVVLDYMNDELYTHVKKMGALLCSKLMNLPYVQNVDGLGLMLGVVLDAKITANDVVEEAIQEGLLLLTAKDKVRLLPPLNISEIEIEKAILILEKVLLKLGDKQ